MAKQEKLAKFCKEKMIEEVALRFKTNPNFFVTSYMGSSVADLELLRRDLKKAQSTYFVVKNSNLRIILKTLKLDEVSPLVEGGVGISLSGGDIISTCKALVNFAKGHDKFKIKGAYLDGRSIPPLKIKELASLPPREVLLARLVSVIQSPITGFVNVLNGVPRKFVYVIDAIRASKSKQGEEKHGS